MCSSDLTVAANFAGESVLVAINVESEMRRGATAQVLLHYGELNWAKFRIELIEHGGIERERERDGKVIVRGANDGDAAEPEIALGVDQAAEEAAFAIAIGTGGDEIGVGLDVNGEAGKIVGFTSEDGGNFGALKNFLWIGCGGGGGA